MKVIKSASNVYKLVLAGEVFHDLDSPIYQEIDPLWEWSTIDLSSDKKVLTVVTKEELDNRFCDWDWRSAYKDAIIPEVNDSTYQVLVARHDDRLGCSREIHVPFHSFGDAVAYMQSSEANELCDPLLLSGGQVVDRLFK